MASLRRMLQGLFSDLSAERPAGNSPDALERNIRVNIYHGIASIMALNLAAPFIGIFAVKLGASDFQVGLLSSGPALVSLLSMIPGGRFIDRQPRKRTAVSRFILVHRLFYLFVASIPFFTQDKQAWLLVFTVAIMNIPASIANIGWQAFISKVVPMNRRAEAFAARNRLMNLAGTLMVLLTGRVIDIVGYPRGYQITFACAFLFSLGELWVLSRVDEPRSDEPVSVERKTDESRSGEPRSGEHGAASGGRQGLASVRSVLREVLSHDRFVRYTLASIVFYLCWQTPWPLFTLYQVKVLGANNTWVSLLNLTNTGGTLLGYGFWARKCNQLGNLTTLFLSSLGIFIVPVAYAVSNSLVTVAVFNLLTGAIFSGVNLALFNQLLEVTPEKSKATYIAYYTTAVNGAAIVAPMLGVSLLSLFGFFWAFIATAVFRFAGSFTFLLVRVLDRRALAGRSTQTALQA
ncbi:MAG: MFS transporter [Bacillota bacterium]